jgi:hypothetical protein
MARVSPAQVVAFIERMQPEISNWTADFSRGAQMYPGDAP